MTFDMIESHSMDKVATGINEKMQTMHKSFDSRVKPENNAYSKIPGSVDGNISKWLGINMSEQAALRPTMVDSVKQMYNGVKLSDGTTSMGLKELSTRKLSGDYYYQNLKQQSGFAAEIAGTTKENLIAKAEGTGITTYRTDDLCGKYGYTKNDPYVDKIRVDSSGNVIERVQVKFVGKDANECLDKLYSKKFDKYFNDGKVDKLEIQKDFYDDVIKNNNKNLEKLEKSLERVKEKGDTKAIETTERQIDRCNKINDMVEKSTVTNDEAIEARLHPKQYTTKLLAKDTIAESHKAGLDSAAVAVTVTAAVSTVDNVTKVFDGEITAQEAFVDVAKDTAIAGGIAYGTTFISTAASQALSHSSSQFISSVGNSCLPAAAVSFGVASYDDIASYAKGEITGKELAYNLGENAAGVAGSLAGAAIGSSIGSVPGAIIGGTVGCAIAVEAYHTAVEAGSEGAEILANKAQELASNVIDNVAANAPEALSDVKNAFSDFASNVKLPFALG